MPGSAETGEPPQALFLPVGLFGQNQTPPSLASLRSPKTRIHLVGFASFSQRTCARWLRSATYPPVALFRQKADARAFGPVVFNDVKQPYSRRGAFAP
jgi:hypothetical protein